MPTKDCEAEIKQKITDRCMSTVLVSVLGHTNLYTSAGNIMQLTEYIRRNSTRSCDRSLLAVCNPTRRVPRLPLSDIAP